MIQLTRGFIALTIVFLAGAIVPLNAQGRGDEKTLRVFIFAGQSNMVGSDSKVKDIGRFPPFVGLEKAQSKVRFSYSIGRENKTSSNGWVDLQPVNNVVGPELPTMRQPSIVFLFTVSAPAPSVLRTS